MSGTVPDISGGTCYLMLNGFPERFRQIIPGVIPYALGNAVGSRKPQVFCTVFDIADGGAHAAAGSCVNDDCLLFMKEDQGGEPSSGMQDGQAGISSVQGHDIHK